MHAIRALIVFSMLFAHGAFVQADDVSRLESRVGRLEARVTSKVESRLAELEARVRALESALSKLEAGQGNGN